MKKTNHTEQLLRLPEVFERLAISRSTFYRGIDLALFPPPVCLGKRTVAWRQTEVEESIRKLPPQH